MMQFGDDLVSLGVSIFLLGAYHYYLKRQVRRNPTYTIQAVNNIVRTAWVEGIMANSKDILAIQTLRNSTMAATFLASTAVLLILGTLTLSGQGDKLTTTWHVRSFNHIGYMINIPATLKDYLTPQRVAAHLNRAGRFYSTGMRAYYFSVPLVFWLFGPHLMVLATAGLIVVLYRLDRA